MNERTKQDREYKEWFVRSVEEGVEAAERGETVSHAEVMGRLRARLENVGIRNADFPSR